MHGPLVCTAFGRRENALRNVGRSTAIPVFLNLETDDDDDNNIITTTGCIVVIKTDRTLQRQRNDFVVKLVICA